MKIFLKNIKLNREVVVALLGAIFWAISGIVIAFFQFNTTEIIDLKFGISTAFFVDLFALLCSFFLVQIIKKRFSFKVLFPFKNKRIWILFLSSFLGAPLGTAMYWMALIEIGATKASAISTLFPILSTMCVYLFLKKKTRWNTILGLFIATTCAFLLGFIANQQQSGSWKGYLFISIAVVAWGFEAFLSSISLESNIDPYVSIFLRSLTSVLVFLIVLLPSFGAYNTHFGLNYFVKQTSKHFYLLLIAGFFTAISFMCYYRALNKISVANATSINITYSFWTMIFEPILIIANPNWKPYPWYIYLLGISILAGVILGLLDLNKLKTKNKHKMQE